MVHKADDMKINVEEKKGEDPQQQNWNKNDRNYRPADVNSIEGSVQSQGGPIESSKEIGALISTIRASIGIY